MVRIFLSQVSGDGAGERIISGLLSQVSGTGQRRGWEAYAFSRCQGRDR